MGAIAALAGVMGLSSLQETREAKRARRQAEASAAQEQQTLEALANRQEPVMPLPDDEAAKRAKRRSIAQSMRRRGRRSTILTGGEAYEPLGGSA